MPKWAKFDGTHVLILTVLKIKVSLTETGKWLISINDTAFTAEEYPKLAQTDLKVAKSLALRLARGILQQEDGVLFQCMKDLQTEG
jgi:hypothetical protein